MDVVKRKHHQNTAGF